MDARYGANMVVFTAMLFVIEPLFLERLLAHRAEAAPEATYRRIEWLHRCLLVLSLVTMRARLPAAWASTYSTCSQRRLVVGANLAVDTLGARHQWRPA